MENWSIADLVEEDWSISDLVEIEKAREKRDKIEREKEIRLLMKRKLPLANLSGAELRQEALRTIVACGLYSEEDIQSAHHRKRSQ